MAAVSGTYLTFDLAGDAYAAAIKDVHEILGMLAIRPLPDVPSAVRGVVDVRGAVLAVVDLRCVLGLPVGADTESSRIVVVQAQRGEIGVVVDRVREVVQLTTSDIDPPPYIGAGEPPAHVVGTTRHAGDVVLVIDLPSALELPAQHLPC
jgi:purine-binding chemotaxis protein CheW